MTVEQQTLVLALPAGMVVVESVEKPAVVRPSEASVRPVRGSRTGQNAKVSLIDATIEHSPAAVDLTGPALADAMSDPHAPGHSRLIAGWLADFTSPHTRAAYYGDLLAFARYANAHGLNMLHASKADVAGFKAILEDPDGDHLSPASVARRISAVSSFYRHLEHEGVTTANPALLVRRPKVSEESMTQALTRGEAARLLEAADTAGPRDHALICLLLLNGLRVSEVCAANISDLHTVEHHQVLKIRRKGSSPTADPKSWMWAAKHGSSLPGYAPPSNNATNAAGPQTATHQPGSPKYTTSSAGPTVAPHKDRTAACSAASTTK